MSYTYHKFVRFAKWPEVWRCRNVTECDGSVITVNFSELSSGDDDGVFNKDKDEVYKRDVWECGGCVYVFEVIDMPSIFSVIRKAASLQGCYRLLLSGWTRTLNCGTGIVHCWVVYYESIKRELKTRPIHECRCDERLEPKGEESTRHGYTGLLGELEHLKTMYVYIYCLLLNR